MEHERFFSINQFRDWNRKLNIKNFTRIARYEAMQPSTSLAQFLRMMVFANHGEINTHEIRDLARELFVGEEAKKNLEQLERDKCLGYTKEVVRDVIQLLKNDAPPEQVCTLLGYISPSRRIY